MIFMVKVKVVMVIIKTMIVMVIFQQVIVVQSNGGQIMHSGPSAGYQLVCFH